MIVDVERIFAETAAAPDIGAVRRAFESYLYLPDSTAVDAVLATYVANQLPGDPVWLQVIGAPSRGKTEIVSSLADMPVVHMLSTLTAQTFASGVKKDRNASLLYRLQDRNKRVIVLKDLTTVLTMHRESRDAVFGQLREIYDGRFLKEFGTGVTIDWRGQLGLIAGVTPVIDRHHSAIAQLGDRFLSLRLPEVDRSKMVRRAADRRGREDDERRELQHVVRSFLEQVTIPSDQTVSASIIDALNPLADLVTHARTGVYRDGYSHEIDDMPELEAPVRFFSELLGLTLGLQCIGHGEESALAIARRVGGDSIPPPRLAVLRLLSRAGEAQATRDVAEPLAMPTKTAHRVLEDLTALRLVTRDSAGPGHADKWSLSQEPSPGGDRSAVEKWEGAGL